MKNHIKLVHFALGTTIFLLLSACGGNIDKKSIATNTPTDSNMLKNSNKLGQLKVSSDKRMLSYEDNTGFFWMGDTAWEMSVDSSNQDVTLYMEDRKKRGFTVIQVSALPTRYSTNGQFKKNKSNDFPFSKDSSTSPDFEKPTKAYWQHIDYIVESARKNNLYVALLPTWNGGLKTIQEAKIYGAFIAERYKDKENIIWVIGGDSNAEENNNKKIWNALGETINKKVGAEQLITYHPTGNSSSTKSFKDAPWLDFHMIQSGHCEPMLDANQLLSNTYKNSGEKPVLDAEPRYESINECFTNNDREGGRVFEASDVREIAYRQLFSGAFGHTYGHHSVWQKYKNGDKSPAGKTPEKEWQVALADDGAQQMSHIVKLMRSRPLLNRVPDQAMIQQGNAIATRGVGYAFIYLPEGGDVTVNLGKISGNEVKAWWFNPRTGEPTEIGTSANSGSKKFTTFQNEDMILVLDDTAKSYETPGQ